MHLPQESGDTLEAILVEIWIAGVLADLGKNSNQVRKYLLENRGEGLTRRNDNSHRTLSIKISEARERKNDKQLLTFHQVIVLRYLFRSVATPDFGEQCNQDRFSSIGDIHLGNTSVACEPKENGEE